MDNGSFSAPGGSAPTPPPLPPPSSVPPPPPTYVSPPPPYSNPYGSPLPPRPKRRGMPGWVIALIAVVAIGGVAAAVVAVRANDDAELEFNEDSREEFIDGCMENGPPASRQLCGCLFDELEKRMTAEELMQLYAKGAEVAAEDPRVVAVVEACY